MRKAKKRKSEKIEKKAGKWKTLREKIKKYIESFFFLILFCCICFFIIFSLLEYLRSFVEASANFRCKHFRNFFESHFSLFMFFSLSLFLLFFFSICVFWFVCECECECEWVCLQWRLKQWESLWGRWTVVGLRIWWWDLGRLIFFFFFFCWGLGESHSTFYND